MSRICTKCKIEIPDSEQLEPQAEKYPLCNKCWEEWKEKMQKYNFNLGGEQSGHIILGKFATTGDGLLVALEALFALRKGKKASEFFDQFKKTPQLLENIEVKDKNIINKPEIKKIIKNADKLIKGNGRILVRKSGTESKIRIMGESHDKKLILKCIKLIKKSIK